MTCERCGGMVLRNYDDVQCFACGHEPGSLRPWMEPTYSSRVYLGGNNKLSISMKAVAARKKAEKAQCP